MPVELKPNLWLPYDEGKTIGQSGSERGVILRDEEYDGAARISLEWDAGNIPYAITCGIYGFMVHTIFGGDLEDMEQRYKDMKVELARLWDLIPYETDPEESRKRKEVYSELHEFVNRFQ